MKLKESGHRQKVFESGTILFLRLGERQLPKSTQEVKQGTRGQSIMDVRNIVYIVHTFLTYRHCLPESETSSFDRDS